MDILNKIQRDEILYMERVNTILKKKYRHNCPYPGYLDFNENINLFRRDISGVWGGVDYKYIKYLLRLEMNKLSTFKMFKKGERRRINKLVKSEPMIDLAKVIINKMRNDRLRKYGRQIGI